MEYAVEVDQVETAQRILDTAQEVLAKAKTIVWNGPVRVFEFLAFAKGTEALAKFVAEAGRLWQLSGGSGTYIRLKIRAHHTFWITTKIEGDSK
jgi:3-phosphoglycerate kinase